MGEGPITQDPRGKEPGLILSAREVTEGFQQWRDVTLPHLGCCGEKRLEQDSSGYRAYSLKTIAGKSLKWFRWKEGQWMWKEVARVEKCFGET